MKLNKHILYLLLPFITIVNNANAQPINRNMLSLADSPLRMGDDCSNPDGTCAPIDDYIPLLILSSLIFGTTVINRKKLNSVK